MGRMGLMELLVIAVVLAAVMGVVAVVARAASNATPPQPAPPDPSVGRWASDPTRRHELRWWDGTRWSPSVSDHGVLGHDPL